MVTEGSVEPKIPYLWLAAIGAAIVLCKTILFPHFPASALFADDYDSLHRAKLFLDGLLISSDETYSFDAAHYPFKLIVAGLLYYVVISPWTLFEFPYSLWFVFFLNSCFAAIYMYFASLAIYRVTKTRSLLIPLVLGTLSVPFIFSFYVMTENMVFPFLAILAWLASDLDNTLRNPKRLALLVAATALLPIIRTPGIAVLPPLLLILALHYKNLGWKRLLIISTILVGTVVLVYSGYLSISGSAREAKYSRNMLELLPQAESWMILGRLTLSQFAYLLVSSGFFVVPLLMLFPFTRAGRESFNNRGLRDLYLFTVGSAGIFVAFCLVHTLMKMDQTGGVGWFIFGRYDDPALVLLMIIGITVAFHFRENGILQRVVFAALATGLLGTAIYYLKDTHWGPIGFTGLSFFALGIDEVEQTALIAWTALCGVLLLIPSTWPWRPHALLLPLLVFNYFTIVPGLQYAHQRAAKIDFTLEGSYWILENSKEDATICMDWVVRKEKAAGAFKRMGNVFRSLVFRTHPRDFYPLDDPAETSRCDYIYSVQHRKERLQLPVVWENEAYIVVSAKP